MGTLFQHTTNLVQVLALIPDMSSGHSYQQSVNGMIDQARTVLTFELSSVNDIERICQNALKMLMYIKPIQAETIKELIR